MVQKYKLDDTETYNMSVVGKNLQITDAIKNYVFEKLSKVEKFTKHIIDVTVTLDVQKLSHTASFLLKFLHFKVKSHATTDDLYSAIDKASDKLVILIEKYKKKMQDHRMQNLSSVDMKVNVLKSINEIEEINESIEEENLKDEENLYKFHEVVDAEVMPLKTLTHDEAVMKMELSGEPFMIFKGEEDQKMKVIYRRNDEHFGLVIVENN